MSDSLPQRNGGQILVEALRRNAVDTVYCIPGESYLPVLDALHDANGIRTIVTRHEGAASNMADAYGKLTGRPGICFVTRGPGATHAANGVHTAQQDSTPMILFVGQVESAFKGREAFQEVDYVQMFSGLAKWAVEIDRIERIPEIVGRAFSVALFLCIELFLMGVTFAPMGALLPEIFPTHVRYTGASAAYNLGGILGASVAPYIAQKLVGIGGLGWVGGYVSAAALLSLLAVLCLKETRDNDLGAVS
ncbi:thiamine pyrophosphate-binding protein [Pseudomonas aeruginosa]|nr:thiamine pyrophosphate-binding protein [Pseudomonas aeruginosa]